MNEDLAGIDYWDKHWAAMKLPRKITFWKDPVYLHFSKMFKRFEQALHVNGIKIGTPTRVKW